VNGSTFSSEVAEEFEGAALGDERRNLRLLRLAESIAKKPDASFPKALRDSAELEAAYRFFNNVKVQPEEILRPHIRRTVQRMAREEVTLVAHDSTMVSFASDDRDGLVERGGNQQFLAHCSLALRADGSRQPLGVVAMSHHLPVKKVDANLQDRWAEHVLAVHALGIQPASVVHLMDCEADDYDLLGMLLGIATRFVIRVKHNRNLDSGHLRDPLEKSIMQAEREVALSRRTNRGVGSKQRKAHPPREARLAKLAIASCSVKIRRPTSALSDEKFLALNVVRVWEPAAPEDQTPVEWLLYTSEPIDSPEQVLQIVDWYCARWTIEEYFKALKTGCSLEKRQLGDLHALTNALALLVPIAWRVLLLRSEAHARPTAAADLILGEEEIQVLRAAATRRPLPANPTVLDAMLSIAGLGGHLKHNGLPGWRTLADGFQAFRALLAGWQLRRAVETGILPSARDQ
jgi:hypothetical protein